MARQGKAVEEFQVTALESLSFYNHSGSRKSDATHVHESQYLLLNILDNSPSSKRDHQPRQSFTSCSSMTFSRP